MSEEQSPFALLQEMEHRARTRAVGLSRAERAAPVWHGVGFRLGGHQLAARLDEVHEVMPIPPLTRVPGTSPWVLGIANVRGVLLSVADLAGCLGGPDTQPSPRNRVLAVDYAGASVGLLVDEVFGARHFYEAEREVAPAATADHWLVPFLGESFSRADGQWRVFSVATLVAGPILDQAVV